MPARGKHTATDRLLLEDALEEEPIGTVTAEPSTVEVTGPASALDRLTEAITEPISVAGASAPVTESVTVGASDPSVRLKDPQSARVSVAVMPACL